MWRDTGADESLLMRTGTPVRGIVGRAKALARSLVHKGNLVEHKHANTYLGCLCDYLLWTTWDRYSVEMAVLGRKRKVAPGGLWAEDIIRQGANHEAAE